jgi:hypothetical protein
MNRKILLMFALGAAAGAVAAHWVTSALWDADVSKLKQAHAKAAADAQQVDMRRLQQAQQRGDALTRQLQTTEFNLTKREKELNDAIRTQTTGHACLSGKLVGVLNEHSVFSLAGVPAPAAVTPAAGGAAGPDADDTTGYASDRDVAIWANAARRQHETCRARLDALIDWYGGNAPTQQNGVNDE